MGHLERDALSDIWITYKRNGGLELRNELLLHYTSLVRYVAAKVGATVPAEVDREDLVSYGLFGLMDAIEKFDLSKGVKFETYAVARIRGAIVDEIRSLDWVPRSVRSKARDIERARLEVEGDLGRPADHQEVAQHLGLALDEYWALTSQAIISPVQSYAEGPTGDDTHFGDRSENLRFDPAANPEDLTQTTEIVNLIGDAVDGMDERSKTILVLYYIQELTLAEIGRILGVTESRVCQLQSKALSQLGEALGQGGSIAA